MDDIVNQYNHTRHRTIKIKPVDVKSSTYIDFGIDNNDKDPKSKVGDHAEYRNTEIFLQKGYVPNWSEGVFVTKKVKNIVQWTYIISDLNGEEIVGMFYKEELQKTNQTDIRIKKKSRAKMKKYLSNGKVNIIHVIIGLIKILLYKMSYFPEPYTRSKNKIKVELNLCNYATKSDL